MGDSGVNLSGGEIEWEYQQGEELVEQSHTGTPQMPGAEGIETDPTEYTVRRRLYDPDDDERLYWLEWERETPGGPSVENQLYTATLVGLHYRAVDTEAEDGE